MNEGESTILVSNFSPFFLFPKIKVATPQAASATEMRAADRRARIGIGGGRK